MRSRLLLLFTIFLCFSSVMLPQSKLHHNAVFIPDTAKGFYDLITKERKEFNKKPSAEKKKFKMDFSKMEFPTNINDYTKYWHNAPLSQGETGTCWCFSSTSFFESEIYRLTKQEIKLSEMFTTYWEYVEKARRFIIERGNSAFAEGSEANAVRRIWKEYGIVPADAYTGKKPGQKFHDHSTMFSEMDNYLKTVKANNAWNEEEVLSTIKSIMNHYIGIPPVTVTVDGKTMTPKEYLKNVIKLNLDDYIDILSLMEKPYKQYVEYEVPDNWWHSSEYYNLSLDEYMKALKKAVRSGYTIALGGDVSEPGYDSYQEVGIVPTFDIPSEYIDESARQFRFTNGTTTDDHGIHLIGYCEKDGNDWYLIKDSGAGGMNGKNIGYYFYHEDYVKLKIVDFMVHKDAVKEFIN